jgi:YMGG-like Gly-zipper
MTIMKKFLKILTLVFALSTVGYYSHAQTQTKTVTKTKKGWSNKAKGAAIGGGAGAVTGAVVSHNKAKGAVIGGAVGAGAGYLIGRHKDKKNPNSRKTVYKTKTTSSGK